MGRPPRLAPVIVRTLPRRGRGACNDRIRFGGCGLHIGDFGAYTAPEFVDSDRVLRFARFAVRRRPRWGCGSLPVSGPHKFAGLGKGCGIGVEDPHLPPAVGTNVAVVVNHERTLQEKGRERESLKKKGHRKVQQKTLPAQNSGHLGKRRGECSRRNILFFGLQLCGWRSPTQRNSGEKYKFTKTTFIKKNSSKTTFLKKKKTQIESWDRTKHDWGGKNNIIAGRKPAMKVC